MKVQRMSLPDISGLIIDFDSSERMVRSMLRFSEFTSKSVKFGRVFQLEDYLSEQNISPDKCAKTFEGVMVLDHYITDFVAACGFELLMQEELDILEVLEGRGLLERGQKADQEFFVIGIGPAPVDRHGLIMHEVSHIVWRRDAKYRQMVEEAFDSQPATVREMIRDFLADRGYTHEEILDEYQAHLLEGFGVHRADHWGPPALKNYVRGIVGIQRAFCPPPPPSFQTENRPPLTIALSSSSADDGALNLYNWDLQQLIACDPEELADLQPLVDSLVGMADKARREGIFSLEDDIAGLSDPLLRSGIQLLMDGADVGFLRAVTESRVVMRGRTGVSLRRDLIISEGLVCIQQGFHPNILLQKLGGFLLPYAS